MGPLFEVVLLRIVRGFVRAFVWVNEWGRQALALLWVVRRTGSRSPVPPVSPVSPVPSSPVPTTTTPGDAAPSSPDGPAPTPSTLYTSTPHPHVPQNVNALRAAAREVAGFNARLALRLTQAVGTMDCAYLFGLLALLGFPGFNASPAQYVQWVSQTFIQLVMLSVIMVGQSEQAKGQELQADEMFQTTQKTYHDLEEQTRHLDAQDRELLRQTGLLVPLSGTVASLESHVLALAGTSQTTEDRLDRLEALLTRISAALPAGEATTLPGTTAPDQQG